jgi:hypothetical protein
MVRRSGWRLGLCADDRVTVNGTARDAPVVTVAGDADEFVRVGAASAAGGHWSLAAYYLGAATPLLGDALRRNVQGHVVQLVVGDGFVTLELRPNWCRSRGSNPDGIAPNGV